MKKYTYNFEIKDLLTQFVAAFDDTVIKRYNKQRDVRQQIEVRYVFAPKHRVMYDVVNKAQNITLPVVTIDLASVTYDSSRAFNKVNKLHSYITEEDSVSMPMPTPVNLTVNMSILGKYMQDVEQIITNFAPYANPYIILAWREPTSYSDTIEIRSEVLWDENISITTPTEISYSDKFRVVADTSFTIKGWLFKNQNERDTPIYFIEQNMIAESNNWNIAQPLTSLEYDNFFNEYVENPDRDSYMSTVRLSGTPVIDSIFLNEGGKLLDVSYNAPITFDKSAQKSFLFTGKNYDHTTNVWLSSDNSSFMSGLTSIDTKYTGSLSGAILPVENYNILSNNTLTVNLPPLNEGGKIDIIINNPAGWTSTRTISGFYTVAE